MHRSSNNQPHTVLLYSLIYVIHSGYLCDEAELVEHIARVQGLGLGGEGQRLLVGAADERHRALAVPHSIDYFICYNQHA